MQTSECKLTSLFILFPPYRSLMYSLFIQDSSGPSSARNGSEGQKGEGLTKWHVVGADPTVSKLCVSRTFPNESLYQRHLYCTEGHSDLLNLWEKICQQGWNIISLEAPEKWSTPQATNPLFLQLRKKQIDGSTGNSVPISPQSMNLATSWFMLQDWGAEVEGGG